MGLACVAPMAPHGPRTGASAGAQVSGRGGYPPRLLAMIANSGANSVTVYDVQRHELLATVPVGRHPVGVAFAPDGEQAYVTNLLSGTVSVISSFTFKVVDTVRVARHPMGVVATSRGVYVAEHGTDTVSVVHPRHHGVIARIPVGLMPHSLAATSDGTSVYVTNNGASTVSRIDGVANRVVATFPAGTYPAGVAIPRVSGLYVAGTGSGSVRVMSLQGAPRTTIPVGRAPLGVAATPYSPLVHVANTGSDTMSMINSRSDTVVATVKVGRRPEGVASDLAGTRVYVTNNASNSVSVIATGPRTVIATLPTGRGPEGVAISPR
jgi:YVTN family beta-propeller protein